MPHFTSLYLHINLQVQFALLRLFVIMQSVAMTSMSSAVTTRATARPETVAKHHICIPARPIGRSSVFGGHRNTRSPAVQAVWSVGGRCGPSYQQQWGNTSNMQRSFEKWAEQASNSMWFPVDVEETAQEYSFVADVPGLGKKDIKVQSAAIVANVYLHSKPRFHEQVQLLCTVALPA